MKTYTKNLLLLPALMAGLGLTLADRVVAQTFTTLHSFTALVSGTNIDGVNPYAGLILSSNTLFGTASYGGSSSNGTVFKLNTDGTGFTNLYSFPPTVGAYPHPTNRDGAVSWSGLILSGNSLYGTAKVGGSNAAGTVFKVNTDGTGFTNLHSFLGPLSDGANPYAKLFLSSNTLYGTAYNGGSNGFGGTIFKVNTNGTGFTNLHSFNFLTDGGYPYAGVILSSNKLYGTAFIGGGFGNGTVFALTNNGTGFTILHSFTTGSGAQPNVTNSDGAFPQGTDLILSSNTLYGAAYGGGSNANGTVFALTTSGAGFTNLHNFTATSTNSSGVFTNRDGAHPDAGLILFGNTLYGTARYGGASGNGAVFALNTDGTGFTNLHSFTASRTNSSGIIYTNSDGTATGIYTNSDGTGPGGLILSGNTLYGLATGGGISGNGTVFSLSLPLPPLATFRSGTNIIVTWPANATGFKLQSTTNLVSAVWNTNLPSPVLVNGQNTVTNPISGTKKFYRLSQ